MCVFFLVPVTFSSTRLHLVAKQPPHCNLFAHSIHLFEKKNITLGPCVIVLSFLNFKISTIIATS